LNQISGSDSRRQKEQARRGGHAMVYALLTGMAFALPLVAGRPALHVKIIGGT
jgi:hypothetical protein